MRCSALENLGLLGAALEDARDALKAMPRAPKLWAKAASLALQTVETEGGTHQDSEGVPLGGASEVKRWRQRISPWTPEETLVQMHAAPRRPLALCPSNVRIVIPR